MMTYDEDDYTDTDLAESIEPVVWLLTVYPNPDEPWSDPEGDINTALLGVYEINAVELKRMS